MDLRPANCSVTDAQDERPRRDAEVHVRGDRIARVGAADAAPDFADARRLDLEGSCVFAVANNPLDDIRHLRHPRLVLRGGTIAVDELDGS
jgi:hypothetical protein